MTLALAFLAGLVLGAALLWTLLSYTIGHVGHDEHDEFADTEIATRAVGLMLPHGDGATR